jgi:rod shape determining protein RodA
MWYDMNAYFKRYFDFRLAAMTLVLLGAGMLAIFSATYDAGASRYFYQQILWAVIGFLGMLFAIVIPNRMLERIAIPAYIISLGVLLIILIIGKTVSGSTSWLGFWGIGGQPSELTKITTVLALAAYLSRANTDVESIRGLLTTAGIIIAPAILVLAQPDTGTALVFAGIFLPILYWSGARIFTIFAMVAPVIAAVAAFFGTVWLLITLVGIFVILYFMKRDRFVSAAVFGAAVFIGFSVQFVYQKLPVHQQKRIATFLAPNIDPLGAGYNVMQSKVAIGSGGFTGKGFLHGTQTQLRFIPAQWTDFIFCVPGEEFGFIGAALLLILLTLFLMRGVRIASVAKSKFLSVVAIGITSILGIHIFVNIAMALGLIPVIGIPLPFISYGGSSLIASMVIVGLLLNVYANRKEY